MAGDDSLLTCGGERLQRATYGVGRSVEIQKEDRKMQDAEKKICEKGTTQREFAVWWENFQREEPRKFHNLLRMMFTAFCWGILFGVILALVFWTVIL